ncbi:MAG TPA: hypothetical protein VK147_04055 [Candidatus Didemnitutus sp.]|nr:hypothetical protein [Candidatus Didemnitutus sp.]
MSRIISIVLVGFFLSSCSYWEFTMKEYSGWPVQTRILYDRHNVDRTAENALVISNDARIAMRCSRITDGIFSAEVQIRMGSTLRLQTRTTPYDDSTAQHKGMIIDINNTQTSVTINGRVTHTQTPLPTKAPAVVEIVNDGRWTRVTVACREVGRFESTARSTEWIIASLPSGGSALIADPTFEPLYSTN